MDEPVNEQTHLKATPEREANGPEASSSSATEERVEALAGNLQPRSIDAGFSPTVVAGEPGETQTHLGALAARELGPYHLIRELGRGGMGVVYLAEERELHRRVALKILAQGIASNADSIERFRREASACARLEHPNVVRLHGMGEAEGYHYFAMEYVEGRPLSDVIARERVSPERGALIALQAARGLGHAHERGVVHRDVKPHNLLVTHRSSGTEPERRGRRLRSAALPGFEGEELVKVADFGLARLEGTHTLTASGDIMGTPAYMSPEQARGARGAVSTATDVYSLGATLYEMLTGQPPFAADELGALLRKIDLDDPVRPRRVVPALDGDLETIVLKCLEKEPRRRYAHAGELADDLARWLDEEPVRARPVGVVGRAWRRARRNPIASGLAALLVLIVAGGCGALGWRSFQEKREVSRCVAAAEEALRSARTEDAARALDSLAALDSGHPRLDFLRARLEFRKALDMGIQARDRYRSSQQRIKEAAEEVSRLRKETLYTDPLPKKRILWEAERREAEARRLAKADLDSVLTYLVAADRLGGVSREASSALMELYLELYDDAVARREEGEIRYFETKVCEYGGPKAEEELCGRVEVLVDCEPADATFHLFQYRAGSDGVSFPEPIDPQGESKEQVQRPPLDPVPLEEVDWLEPHIDRPRADLAVSEAERLLGAGRRKDAESKLRDALAFDAKHLGARWNLSRLLASGERTSARLDEALTHLEAAVALGEELCMIQAEPLFESLRGNPRFDSLPDLFAGRIPARHLLVTSLPAEGLAVDLGLRPGDVLLAWNGTRIEAVEDARAVISASAGDVEVQVLRAGKEMTLRARVREPIGFTLSARNFDAAFPTRRVLEARAGTAYPLRQAEWNRIAPDASGQVFLSLRPGSYLLLVSREGYLDARLPIDLPRIGRTEGKSGWRGRVRLFRAEGLPPGVVHVPAGPFRMGGDREARQKVSDKGSATIVDVDDFLIARFPVTVGEWLQFLNDPAVGDRVGSAGDLRLVPRGTERTDPWFVRGSDGVFHAPEMAPRADWSVTGISWEDAREYVRWLSGRLTSRCLLPEGWEVRLPTEEEWEKAARGADGRFFPWGDRADPGLARVDASRSLGLVLPEPQGLFPADESPYGVRDMAGGEMELTGTGVNDVVAVHKGGCWSASIDFARCANNQLVLLRSVSSHGGFRWVIARARK